MEFETAFAECMEESGIHVDPGSVDSPGTLADAVAYVQQWLEGLDGNDRDAFDDASEHPEIVAALLVEANIAPAIPGLMESFDNSQGMPLSTYLQWCAHCAEQAAEAQGDE